jgi:hypothetical protein
MSMPSGHVATFTKAENPHSFSRQNGSPTKLLKDGSSFKERQ